MVITKENCPRIFAASMRVISAMKGNPPLKSSRASVSFRLDCLQVKDSYCFYDIFDIYCTVKTWACITLQVLCFFIISLISINFSVKFPLFHFCLTATISRYLFKYCCQTVVQAIRAKEF